MPVQCEICDREFQHPAHLEKHLARKTPCSQDSVHDKNHQCPSCSKSFRFLSNLCRHRHICKGPKATVADLQSEVAELRTQVRQLTTGGVTNIDNSVHNITTVDNSVHITLNNYGHETQDHLEKLSFQDMKKILKLTPDHNSLTRMITFIHMNDEVPQNRTIRLDDKDSSVINVFRKGKWREKNTDSILYDLICRNRLRFVDVEATLRAGMSKEKYQEFAHYLSKAEDMANSENADLHVEFAFQDLMTKIRERIAV